MKNRHRAYHYLLLLSMPLCPGLGEARAQTIAELAQRTDRTGSEENTRRHPAGAIDADTRETRKAVASISDDGNGNERLPSTSQLVISSNSPVDGPMTLEILNDRGHSVQRRILSGTIGQAVWPIDLCGLQRGRYVERVSHADGSLVSRFRRE